MGRGGVGGWCMGVDAVSLEASCEAAALLRLSPLLGRQTPAQEMTQRAGTSVSITESLGTGERSVRTWKGFRVS